MSSPRIILLAHGSSDKRWCETFEKLAAPTLASVDNARVAYMELAEPSIDTIKSIWGNFKGLPQTEKFPMAPNKPILYFEEDASNEGTYLWYLKDVTIDSVLLEKQAQKLLTSEKL